MRFLKITLPILLFIALTSCKKDKYDNNLDFEGYYIVGKYNERLSAIVSYPLPYIITFGADAKVEFIGAGATGTVEGNYTYHNGLLTISFGGNDENLVFKIEGQKITTKKGFDYIKSYGLHKTPSENLLKGNTYIGEMRKAGGGADTYHLKFKFNETKYGETGVDEEPLINKFYKLIKNVAGTEKSSNSTLTTLFVLVNEKLEVYRYNPDSNGSGNYYYGTLTKQ